MLVTGCGIRNAAERSHLLPRFDDWYRCDGSGSRYCCPSFSPHIQWRNMRQSSGVSQCFNETTGLGSILSQVRISHVQLLILIVNFLQYYRKAINLEHMDNGIDGVLSNSHPALYDEQSNEKPTEQLDANCRKNPEV